MRIDVVGMIATRLASESLAPEGPVVDVAFTRAFARAHEEAGFDRVLIGAYSDGPDGVVVAADVLAHTERLGVLLAHRPGFVTPTVFARQLATLDRFGGGRVSLHVVTGGSDVDLARDGDALDHDARYRRTDEYLTLLRRVWTEEGPIDHAGEHYRVAGARSQVRPLQRPHPPISFGGSSDAAIEVAARHADVYALWGEPLADAAAHVQRVLAAAARHGRRPRISMSFRPILADTEEAAWARARAILESVQERGRTAEPKPQAVGSARLLAAAARGDVVDERLYTAIAAATGAYGNTTALVGTPEQVAASLLRYVDVGVSAFVIRGFDPLRDAIAYGELVRLVRAARS
ncbi:MAG: LLM class flavin-dependent oxidoreductase [Thermoleophilia bacterium]